jgi:hypothetical protein
MKKQLLAVSALILASASAQAAVVTVDILGGYHLFFGAGGSQTGGVIQSSIVYGDGVTAGITPPNICIDGSVRLCSDSATSPGGPYVNGNNGAYWGTLPVPNAAVLAKVQNPNVTYSGTITFDTLTGQVLGGSLVYNGAYGFEVSVPAGATGNPGGSFFSQTFVDSNINLATGLRTTGSVGGVPTAVCSLGAAGAIVVGNLLCGPANNPANFSFHQTGANLEATFTNIVRNAAGVIVAGDLDLRSFRFTNTGSGNNLQETFRLAVIPVPAAVWLFASALGLLGFARRRALAA